MLIKKKTKADIERINARYEHMNETFKKNTLEELYLIKNNKRSSTDSAAYRDAVSYLEVQKEYGSLKPDEIYSILKGSKPVDKYHVKELTNLYITKLNEEMKAAENKYKNTLFEDLKAIDLATVTEVEKVVINQLIEQKELELSETVI